MFYENRGGHRALVKDVEADANQILTVPLGEVSHRTDKSRFGLTEFRSPFRRGILPHNDAVLRAARFLKSAEGAKCARIINGPDHHMPGVRETQVLAHGFKAGPQFTVAFQVSHAAIRRAWQY